MAVPRKAKLFKKKIFNKDVSLLEFHVDEELEYIGGQYIILNTGIKDVEGNEIKRAYSLLSLDEDPTKFEICVKSLPGGQASPYLLKLEENTELTFSGPWGKFLKNPLWPSEGHTLIVVTDTAITTALGLIQSKKLKPFLPDCHLIWMVTDTFYFMPFEFVNHRIPDDFVDFQTVQIPPIGDPNRIIDGLNIIKQKLEHTPFPKNVFLAGDGSILYEIKNHLEMRGLQPALLNLEPFFNKLRQESEPPKGFVRSGTTGKLVAMKDLREGFTTGACSAAAAKAATRALMTGKKLDQIESTLPNRKTVVFKINRCDIQPHLATCSVIKDAGDDPDATHGAELIAQVKWVEGEGIAICGGEGVAKVTKSGLGLDVGSAAINPVPRKNITEMVQEELMSFARGKIPGKLEVTISVPQGREMAKKTLNERLGLIGGISILGTTGIVKPYSTAAYRASVVQAIQLASTNGLDTIVLTTGGKSEKYAMDLHPHLDSMAFIQVGDFIGAGIKAAIKNGIRSAIVVGMMGKLSKMADGRMMTHAAGSDVNFKMLSEIGQSIGVPSEICAEIEKANTARHVLEICQRGGFPQITKAICERVVRALLTHAGAALGVSCYLVDFNGVLLGEYHGG